MNLSERIKEIRKLAQLPMKSESEMQMVEIICLKFKDPEVEVECAKRIIENTEWPFKLNFYDNRLNTANTSKIWNKLIKDSTCDYVMFIDSDAFVPKLEPCWLTRMMESFENPECRIVVPLGDNVGGSNKSDHAENYPSQKMSTGIWSGFCWLMKKTVVDEIGWLDEDFYLYGQDSEYAYRARGITWLRNDVLVQHKGSYSAIKSNQKGTLDRDADKAMARILFEKKC